MSDHPHDLLLNVRKRHVKLLRLNLELLANILYGVTQEAATTLRDPDDGDKGWTVLEVVSHLRDFDGFFRGRAQLMLDADNPTLPAYDHEAIALERAYNQGDLRTAFAELRASRQQTRDFFIALTDEQWQRTGIHPENGLMSMTDALMQVGHHDVTHIEQITRIVSQVPRALRDQ